MIALSKQLFFIFVFTSFLPTSTLNISERIISFDVTLELHQDASMDVTEKITVFSAGENIKQGIVREISTVYQDYFGTRSTIDFVLKEVLQDGQVVHYALKNERQGKIIEIGTDEKITPGIHEYIIKYSVNRQLGFFKDYDELYWNVTGSNWRLSMDEISAIVILPKEIPMIAVAIDGYTGKHGAQGKDFVFTKTENKIIFHITRNLKKFEGFTISVSWPTGLIKEPTLKEKISWFLYDNNIVLLLFFCFLALLFMLLYLVYIRYFYHEKGTIIPLFYQPASLTPSQVGYIYYLIFKERFFAADIVDLAVRGFVEIDYEPKKLFGGTYILKKKKDAVEKYDQLLFSQIFSSSDTIKINSSYEKQLHAAAKKMWKYSKNSLKEYVRKTYIYDIIAVIICVPMVFIIHKWFYKSIFFALVLAASFSMMFLIMHFSHFYTEKGRKLKDEIDGFKLFLTTTEIERMNIVGTPPTKTPELYEKYLPYAIALGVEKQWTKQFAAVFEKLQQSETSPVFVWYRGKNFNVSQFGSSFPSAFTSSIRSTGAGGKGSSGGGRGGGGGGAR